MKDFSEINDLVESVECRMQDAYEQGYETGYKDGKKKGEQEGYEKGLKDVWTATKKIFTLSEYEWKSMGFSVFGDDWATTYRRLFDYEPDHVIKQLEWLEEGYKKDEIQVGDVVENNGILGIVTFLEDKPFFQVICSDGSLGHWGKSEVVKTGKSFSQITEVLEQLKGENKNE